MAFLLRMPCDPGAGLVVQRRLDQQTRSTRPKQGKERALFLALLAQNIIGPTQLQNNNNNFAKTQRGSPPVLASAHRCGRRSAPCSLFTLLLCIVTPTVRDDLIRGLLCQSTFGVNSRDDPIRHSVCLSHPTSF
jgi:hypothetical protein